jgi:Fur family ferric uptake transcriptional regulator
VSTIINENILQLGIIIVLTEKRVIHNLHERGYKLTPARRRLIGVIAASTAYLTPTGLYEKAGGKASGISLVTIYRTLDILSRLGFICEVFTESRARSYLLHRLPVHHHHLICSGCGTVLDFTGCGLDALEKKLSRSTGFNIDNHRLEFSGKCRECQKKL